MGQKHHSNQGENLKNEKNRAKKICSQIKKDIMDENMNQNDANRLREDAGDGGDQGEAMNNDWGEGGGL